MLEKNDWRLDMPVKYLENEEWIYKKYSPKSETWEHEHCSICGTKISENPDDILEALASTSKKDYWWICPKCYEDLKEHYKWTLKEAD